MSRRWMRIGSGIAASVTTILGLFLLLQTNFGFQINDITGDIICEGTYENPCISEFEVKNPTMYDVDIYSKDQVKLDFSPNIKDYGLFVPDGRCSATGKCACELKDGRKLGFKGLRCVDFTNKTKPRSDKVYNFRFPKYSTTTFTLAGIKNNPSDDIKWGFGTNDEYLDPAWFGEEREIGYEFINNSVVHIWNTQDDYFFEKDAGIQLTNHYEDYWTKNIFCLYYNNSVDFVKVKCSDELKNFNKKIETDNETYVNSTLWKDFSYGPYDLRLGVQYHLGLDDENLSVTIYGKNIGIDIPFDLGFVWKVKDVNIPGLGEDYIDINGTSYILNGTYDLTFKDMNESYFNIHDITKFLRLDWNNNLNYAVKMYGNGNQDNFSISTLINAGHFNPGQEKSTTFKWIDADTVVATDAHSQTDIKNSLKGPYWINSETGIIVFVDSGNDLVFTRTIDGGANWAQLEIDDSTLIYAISAWYDRETPGDNGNLVHISWQDETSPENIKYVNVDISDGSIGTIRTIDSTVTLSNRGRIAITKTISGNLVMAFETQSEVDAYLSNDSGVSWSGISDPYETPAEEDWLRLYPANTGDDNDVAGIFWDRSASAISLKMYDDSENTWTETSISGSMLADLDLNGMDASVRHSDNHILLVAHSDANSAGDDFLTWDLTVDSIASPTITAKTNIFTDQGVSVEAAVLINQQNDDVYVGYLKGGTWQSSMDVYYYNSTDGFSSWGSEKRYSQTTDDYRVIHGGRTVGDSGGRVQWSFYDDDQLDIYVNLVNDIEIPASGPSDTCTYDTGNWDVTCSDNCTIDSNVNVGGNNLSFTSSGDFRLNANISGIDKLSLSDQCKVILNDGTFLVL